MSSVSAVPPFNGGNLVIPIAQPCGGATTDNLSPGMAARYMCVLELVVRGSLSNEGSDLGAPSSAS